MDRRVRVSSGRPMITVLWAGLYVVAVTVGVLIVLLAFLGLCVVVEWIEPPCRDVNDTYSG